MSIPMAPCWDTRTSSQRSTCAAPITRRSAWALVTSTSSFADGDRSRRLSRLPARPHLCICGFDAAAEQIGVEQGAGLAIALQLVAQFLQCRRVGGQLHGERL